MWVEGRRCSHALLSWLAWLVTRRHAALGLLRPAGAARRGRRLDGEAKPVVGFCFSFPMAQTALDAGTVARLTKRFENAGMLGGDPVRMLSAALERASFPVRAGARGLCQGRRGFRAAPVSGCRAADASTRVPRLLNCIACAPERAGPPDTRAS